MKITILSMGHAKVYKPKENSVIIRIADGGYELDELEHLYNHELILSFYDIEPRAGLPTNWNWFNKTDGEKVINFFKQIEGCNELVIHCHAGISRSPALALSYGWYKDNNDIVNQILNGNYLPNNQVLEIMSRLIFEDKRVARSKFADIRNHFKNRVETEGKSKVVF